MSTHIRFGRGRAFRALPLLAVFLIAVLAIVHPTASGTAVTKQAASLSRPDYSDREVLSWLLAAAGPIAEDHPDSLRYLGLTDETKPPLHQRALDSAITRYLRFDPRFHADVAVPMQSGDPLRVEQAFRVFTARAKQFVNDSTAGTSMTAAQNATAAGKIGAKVKVAVYVAVLANAVVYANAAVATNVAATLVLVWFYLMDYSATSPASDFEREQFIAKVSSDLG